MPMWLMQADSGGQCCDCGGRQDPCESCLTCPVIEYEVGSLAEANALLAQLEFGGNCFMVALSSGSHCNYTEPDCNGSENCSSTPYRVLSSYTPTSIVWSRSVSSGGSASAGGDVQVSTILAVPAGTEISISYGMSGAGFGGTGSGGATLSISCGGHTIVSTTGASISGTPSYTTTEACCLIVSAVASARYDESFCEGQFISVSFNLSISFSKEFTANPIEVFYPGGSVVCS